MVRNLNVCLIVLEELLARRILMATSLLTKNVAEKRKMPKKSPILSRYD